MEKKIETTIIGRLESFDKRNRLASLIIALIVFGILLIGLIVVKYSYDRVKAGFNSLATTIEQESKKIKSLSELLTKLQEENQEIRVQLTNTKDSLNLLKGLTFSDLKLRVTNIETFNSNSKAPWKLNGAEIEVLKNNKLDNSQMTNYYTKSSVDELFETKSSLKKSFETVENTFNQNLEKLETALNDYSKKTDYESLNKKLADYNTITELDKKLTVKIDKTSLESEINKRLSKFLKDEIETKYALKSTEPK